MTELQAGALLFLIWNSITDIGKRQISLLSLLILGLFRIIHFVLHLPELDETIWLAVLELLAGALPGILLCITGKISRGAIGYGDGIAVIATGLCVGVMSTALMVMWAFFAAFFWSLILLVMKKYKAQSRFPFVPFLLIGLILSMWF